ncbi:MAG: elongation factor G [Acidobacteriota bacterium]
MHVDHPAHIRNIALAGHGDTGKTTLASALLYTSGVSNRLNRVEDGNAPTDFDAEEISRGFSIGLGVCSAPWRKHKINVIDTPGAGIFGAEARAGVRAADAMMLVVNAVSGVEVTTEKLWNYATDIALPTAIHLNKMDRERADLGRTLESLRASFSRSIVPIQLPIGSEGDFTGVVDLVNNRVYRYAVDGDGRAAPSDDLPAELADAIEEARTELIEAVAESSEALMELYFEEGTLSDEQLRDGLREAVRTRQLFPLTCGVAAHGIGTSALCDAILDVLPDPLARETFPTADDDALAIDAEGAPAALVFKTLNDPFSGKISIFRVVRGTVAADTTYHNSRAEENEKIGHLLALQGKQTSQIPQLVTGDIGGVAKLKHTHTGDTLATQDEPARLGWIMIRPAAMSFSIEPKSKGDEEKINDALNRLMEEDLSLQSGRDPQTGEVLISGTGQQHVELVVSKLKSRYKVEVILHPPKVPYRETVRVAADGHGRHKKQSGGRGQFADCKIRIEPLGDGTEFEFVDEIFGGAIPQGFRPAVEKGIQEARRRGYLAGYPVGEFRVRLLDGQYHDVDSSEMAFKVAGSLAFKDAMTKAKPTMLEPIMQVEITTGDEFMGDLMSDLSSRRGRPQGMEAKGDKQVIQALVPLAEMLEYAPKLRSITQGRANFVMEFSHYDEVPRQIQQKIIEAHQGGESEGA